MAAYEVEMKFPLRDVEAVRQALLHLGAVPEAAISQRDVYFLHPVRDFAQTDEAFRIRTVGDRNCLTYKGPLLDAQTKSRQEIEVDFQPGAAALQQMIELLRSLSFRAGRAVEKTRTPFHLRWQGTDCHFALDQVHGLGDFLEIEIMAAKEDWEQARDHVLGLAQRLGLSGSERRSYLQLLLEQDGTP